VGCTGLFVGKVSTLSGAWALNSKIGRTVQRTSLRSTQGHPLLQETPTLLMLYMTSFRCLCGLTISRWAVNVLPPLLTIAHGNVAILGDAVGMERTSNTPTVWSCNAIASGFPGLACCHLLQFSDGVFQLRIQASSA